MTSRGRDPYQTLGVRANASDAELRVAYRRLVQLHHPDHNGGSAESARRFEEVQEAYARVRELRGTTAGRARAATGSEGTTTGSASRRRSRARSAEPPPQADADPQVDSRLADLERELRQAQAAREAARRAARRAAEQSDRRPTDEELGYFTTKDSLTKIIDDAAAELSDRFSQARNSAAGRRASDLIDELGSKLTGDPPDRGSSR
jgi:curved DNA-binding protein CbpA